jgi:protoporphyrinogen oxidase
MSQRIAVIIGAGPAGLTAAYELLGKTDIQPVIYEATGDIGGISKTLNYKGNRIDLGGHRFFSKSDRIMEWWEEILPLQGAPARDDIILGRDVPLSTKPEAPDPEKTDRVMLIRSRVSRIFFLGRFFDYPVTLNAGTLANLGLSRIFKIAVSYLKARACPIRQEASLEDFLINRFGKELYLTFFKEYTEKVWGVAPSGIKPQWGAQRIKGLSAGKTALHAIRSVFSKDDSVSQKQAETTLISRFLYPKLGPGQMWNEVARIIKTKGGEIHPGQKVVGLNTKDRRIAQVKIRDTATSQEYKRDADFVLSSMPVKELIEGLGGDVPCSVREVADGLVYREFITVGLLLRRLKIENRTGIRTVNNIIPDNWIYIQEKNVRLGRLQVFNNWSPYMVKDPDTVWLGLEYFCSEGDDLWARGDREMTQLGTEELAKIGIINEKDVLDSIVVRMPKTYPAYFGTYDKFDVIREFTDGFGNLFLIGRNGMHKYNNQDHSMLTAITAVENIINGVGSKDNIWAVNTEEEYHEQK